MEAKYITTTLPYVNADPHIGFGYEVVVADALACFFRMEGHEVFFNTGTDEHGLKIFQKAEEAGKDVQEYVDYFAGEFGKLKEDLTLSYNAFIRTTDSGHVEAAQEIWKRCEKAGDIYKKKYKGLYCVGDEVFLKESDLVEGRCPNHPNQDPIVLEEENYFFRLSKYTDFLLEYLNREGVIVPEWRRQEAINFVKGGLEDFSISREKERLSWGIPVPGDDSQVMYVWFDALTNYISTLGWPKDSDGDFQKFWTNGKTLQLAGKDQIRFQSIMWQAMLKSAGIKPTDQILYHGFITSGGQKMSKSLGNVIGPKDLVKKYGTDATRYLLLRHVHPFDDTDITWERLDEWYTAHLVNGLGNLVARVMKLAEQYLDGPVDKKHPGTFSHGYSTLFKNFEFNRVADIVWTEIQQIDEYIAEKMPFKLVKENEIAGKKMIVELVWRLVDIGHALKPLMPNTAKEISKAVWQNKKPDSLFPRL